MPATPKTRLTQAPRPETLRPETLRPETLRIDKWLWHVRFAKTRSAAQVLVQTGHIRLNGRRIEKPGQTVRIGDVMTLAIHGDVRAVRIITLPPRRLGADAAAACWAVADALAPESST